jgi:hypothetical protein
MCYGPTSTIGPPGATCSAGRAAAFTSYLPCDPDTEQPTLYYEVIRSPLPRAGMSGPRNGLAALLGHSRAAVLT